MLNHRSKCHHCHISNYLYPQTRWTLGHKHRTSNCPTGQTSEYHQTSSIQMEDTRYKHSGREIIHGVLIKQACCSSHANHDHQHSTTIQRSWSPLWQPPSTGNTTARFWTWVSLAGSVDSLGWDLSQSRWGQSPSLKPWSPRSPGAGMIRFIKYL